MIENLQENKLQNTDVSFDNPKEIETEIQLKNIQFNEELKNLK